MSTTANKQSEDAALIEAFEDCSLSSLSHEDHVRLGYVYLSEAPFIRVLAEFPEKLRRFAASKGAHDLYHETITWAFMALIHERMSSGPNNSWQVFATANPDLLERSALERYYSKQALGSELARRVFVLPRLEHPSRN